MPRTTEHLWNGYQAKRMKIADELSAKRSEFARTVEHPMRAAIDRLKEDYDKRKGKLKSRRKYVSSNRR